MACPSPRFFSFVPPLLRSNLFSCVQDVTGNPQGLSDCLSSLLRDSRISGYFREGAEIRESRGGFYFFCQCQDALWLMVVKANPSGETLIISNPPLFNKSLTSYLRLLILRLEGGVPSKEILIEYGIEFRE